MAQESSDPDGTHPTTEKPDVLSFEEFRFVREEIRFQHDLIGHRVGSYITAQAFLFTAFATAQAVDGQKWFSFLLLPLIAIGVSLLILMAIVAACTRIDKQRSIHRHFDRKEYVLPKRATGDHQQSLWYAKGMPWVFVVAWGILLAYGFISGTVGLWSN